MSEKTKSRIHLLIFLNAAALVAWYFWVNVRPKIIFAACSDVAEKTTQASSRYHLDYDKQLEYNQQRDTCLIEATGQE